MTNKITTAIYADSIETSKQGEFVRHASYREICKQIKDFLSDFGEAHWINDCQMANVMYDGYSIDNLFESGRLTVTVRHGSSEGLFLDVNHMNPKSSSTTYHSLISAKYLIDEDEVWDIAKKLSYAIHLG